MSKRFYEFFLFDIYVALLKIEETVGKVEDANALKHDYKAWDSVIREFEIIGEAMKHLISAEIMLEEYRTIIDFRNLLAHHYFGIDQEEVWDVVIRDLPSLKKEIITKIHIIEHTLKEKLISTTKEQNCYLQFVIDALNKI